MAKKKKKNVGLILTLFFGILSILAVGTYSGLKILNNLDANEKVKDEKALMVGTYKICESTNGIESYNKIHVQIYNKGEKVKEHSVITTDKALVEVDYVKNMVFLDLTDTMTEIVGDLGIYYWAKSNPNENYVKMQIEWLGAPYLSNWYTITDSGLWAMNAPSKNGEVPQVTHSYIYQKKIFVWGF